MWAMNVIVIFTPGEWEIIDKFQAGENFPGDSVVKTPNSQCRGPGFDPWHATTEKRSLMPQLKKDLTCRN